MLLPGDRYGETGPQSVDFLRLREYGKIITNVSELIETIEAVESKTELEDNFTFEITKDDLVVIPEVVSDKVGPIEQIVVTLKLGLEHDSKGDTEHEVSAEARMSIMLFSDQAAFVISRSSQNKPNNSTDMVLWRTKQKRDFREEEVPAVSQSDVNALILSLVDPASPAKESSNTASPDFLKPEAFGILQELFREVSVERHNGMTYAFQKANSLFTYRRVYDDIFGQEKTSFDIHFTVGSGEKQRTIFARNTMETNFDLRFEVIGDDPDVIPSSLPRPKIFLPYTASYEDMLALNELLENEVAVIQSGTRADGFTSIELFDDVKEQTEIDIDNNLDARKSIIDSNFDTDFETHIQGFEDKPGFDPRNFED